MSNLQSNPFRLGLHPKGDVGNDWPDFARKMFDDAPAGWIVTNPSCIVVQANHAAETLLLRSASAMRDKHFSFLIAASDRASFATMAADMLTSAFEASRPLCMKPKTGETVDVVFKAKLIATSLGVPEFISWIFLESVTGQGSDLL